MAAHASAEPVAKRPAEPGRSPASSKAAKGAARPLSSGVVEISSSIFAPSQAIADEIAASGGKGLDVRVITKGLTDEGVVRIRQDSRKQFDSIGKGSMPLLNPWAQKLGGLHANFIIANSAVKGGYASLKPGGGDSNDWLQTLQKNADLLGGLGIKIGRLPTPVNKFEEGKLTLGVSKLKVVVGGFVDAEFDLLLEGMNTLKVSGAADIDIHGAAKGQLTFATVGEELRGSVSLAVNYKSFNGSVQVTYKPGGEVDIAGKAAYSADKLSGAISFVSTDLDAANKFAKEAIAAAGGQENVQTAGPPGPVPAAKEGAKKRALAATGKLAFNLTNWFAGTVDVVVDGKGAITVIGKIAPPGEIILFKQRDWDEEIIKLEAKAYYGIPVVGNLNLFANVSLHAIAKLGPAKLYAIEILGTYSTDPEIQKSIQISGSINISAYGGLRLRAEGGAGIEILDHDLKFGVGIQADVGVKAYADARPTIGYRDPGVFYISGTLDLVAQPILALGGDFFIAIETPWWSPLSDDRWTWPLFSKEWPLSDPIGISASVKDYVLGSGAVPEIELKKPEFDPSKFMTNMVDDQLPNKSGGAGASQGKFKEDGTVQKPVVPPKKPEPKAAPAKPPKKGAKPKNGKSAAPDPKAAKDKDNGKALQNAGKQLLALKGKGAMTRTMLDQELAKIRKAVGVDFDVPPKGASLLVTPKAAGKLGKGVRVAVSPDTATAQKSYNVRAEARAMVLAKVKGDVTAEQLRGVLQQIADILRPRGLTSLELTSPDQDGVEQILAGASPKLPLLKALPRGLVPKGTTVRMIARVVTNEPIVSSSSLPTPSLSEQLPATEAGATYRHSTMLGKPSKPLGGAVLTAGPTQSDVVTWNTSSDRRTGNASHAEHQFIHYMEKKQQSEGNFYVRLASVSININYSPCTVCTDELAGLVSQIRAARKGRSLPFSLAWSKLYLTQPQATTAQGLNILSGAGISLSAPSDARPQTGSIRIHIETL